MHECNCAYCPVDGTDDYPAGSLEYDLASARERYSVAEFGHTYRRLHQVDCMYLDGRRPGETHWEESVYNTVWVTLKQARAWIASDRTEHTLCRVCRPDLGAGV